MLRYAATFLVLAIVAAFMGFGVVSGPLAQTAQLFAMLCMILCVATLVYDGITRRDTSPPV